MDNIILEIRAAEGGDDAKLLVGDMIRIYTNLDSLVESPVSRASAVTPG